MVYDLNRHWSRFHLGHYSDAGEVVLSKRQVKSMIGLRARDCYLDKDGAHSARRTSQSSVEVYKLLLLAHLGNVLSETGNSLEDLSICRLVVKDFNGQGPITSLLFFYSFLRLQLAVLDICRHLGYNGSVEITTSGSRQYISCYGSLLAFDTD